MALALLLVPLVACGGDPFTPGVTTDVLSGPEAGADPDGGSAGELCTPADAAPEASVDAPTSPGDARADGDEGEHQGDDGSAQDAAEDVGASDAQDAAPTCTPFPAGSMGQREYSCPSTGGASVSIPGVFAWDTPDNGCGYAPTPPECQCVETFTCACLMAHDACALVLDGGAPTWAACVDNSLEPMPEVTCR